MVAHDGPGQDQAQPEPVRLGCHPRLEKRIELLVAHPLAAVGHDDLDEIIIKVVGGNAQFMPAALFRSLPRSR